MSRLKIARSYNTSPHKIAILVATAVSGMAMSAQAAEQPKAETITVTATSNVEQENAWARRRPSPQNTAPRSPKPIRP